MNIPVIFYLVVSTLLFFIGVFGFVTRRNLIAMLISIELVLNSVDLNFAVFNRLLDPGQFEGFFFTMFSIAVSAVETAVALAIIINVYRNYHSDQVNSIEHLKY
jgi:NADH-quinone oxidoreductase subunit K